MASMDRRKMLGVTAASLALLTLPSCEEVTTSQEHARLGVKANVTKLNGNVSKVELELYNTGNYHIELFKDSTSIHQQSIVVAEEGKKITLESELTTLSGHTGSKHLVIVRDEQNNYPKRVQLIDLNK